MGTVMFSLTSAAGSVFEDPGRDNDEARFEVSQQTGAFQRVINILFRYVSAIGDNAGISFQSDKTLLTTFSIYRLRRLCDLCNLWLTSTKCKEHQRVTLNHYDSHCWILRCYIASTDR